MNYGFKLANIDFNRKFNFFKNVEVEVKLKAKIQLKSKINLLLKSLIIGSIFLIQSLVFANNSGVQKINLIISVDWEGRVSEL
jgi:hypothetical protein